MQQFPLFSHHVTSALCVSSRQILYYSNCRMSLHEALYSFRLLWLMQTIYTPSIRNNLCRIPCYLFQCNRKIFIIVFHFHLCHLHFSLYSTEKNAPIYSACWNYVLSCNFSPTHAVCCFTHLYVYRLHILVVTITRTYM